MVDATSPLLGKQDAPRERRRPVCPLLLIALTTVSAGTFVAWRHGSSSSAASLSAVAAAETSWVASANVSFDCHAKMPLFANINYTVSATGETYAGSKVSLSIRYAPEKNTKLSALWAPKFEQSFAADNDGDVSLNGLATVVRLRPRTVYTFELIGKLDDGDDDDDGAASDTQGDDGASATVLWSGNARTCSTGFPRLDDTPFVLLAPSLKAGRAGQSNER